MKKLIFTLLLTIGAIAYSSTSTAQSTTRQERREKRAAENEAAAAQLLSAIESQNIAFLANELTYGSPYLQNIQLSQLYGLWVSGGAMKVILPIYGPNNFNGQPSLMNSLNFTVNKYEYSIEQLKNGRVVITIVAQDPWSINTYTFTITAMADGSYSSMSVNTTFAGPVNYMGDVVRYYIN